MKIKHYYVQDEADKYYIRIIVEIENDNDISSCLKPLFIRERFTFDSSIPHRNFPWSCAELFVLSRVFDVFYKLYRDKLNEYKNIGLDYNSSERPPGLRSKYKPNSFNVWSWSKIIGDTGELSDKIWDIHFRK